jgi:hypothetical protein
LLDGGEPDIRQEEVNWDSCGWRGAWWAGGRLDGESSFVAVHSYAIAWRWPVLG